MTPEQISASALRAADRQMESVERIAVEKRGDFNRRGMIKSGNYIFAIAEICRTGFRDACDAAARQIAEIKGSEAVDSFAELENVLAQAKRNAAAIFGNFVRSGGFREDLLANQKLKLDEAMDGIARGILDDFRLGLARGENVSKHKARVEVNAAGGIANVFSDSPNARQTITGGQNVNSSWDPMKLAEALAAMRSAVASSTLAEREREQIEDEAVSLERETASEQPNMGRLRRVGAALTKRLDQVGLQVIGRAIYDNLPSI